MNITSRQLKVFLLTARHQSFSRATEQLFITQSGMSVLIRELGAARVSPVRTHHAPRHADRVRLQVPADRRPQPARAGGRGRQHRSLGLGREPAPRHRRHPADRGQAAARGDQRVREARPRPRRDPARRRPLAARRRAERRRGRSRARLLPAAGARHAPHAAVPLQPYGDPARERGGAPRARRAGTTSSTGACSAGRRKTRSSSSSTGSCSAWDAATTRRCASTTSRRRSRWSRPAPASP